MSNTDSDANDEKSPEKLLTRQIAKKLYALHAKHVTGVAGLWKNASVEEHKLWWSLAKSAVRLMNKNGYSKL